MKLCETQFNMPQPEQESQRVAKTPVMRTFFRKWCEINDSIRPEFVDRETWEEQGGIESVLTAAEPPQTDTLNPEESELEIDTPAAPTREIQILRIPTDVTPAELITIISKIDQDTFPEDSEDGQQKNARELRQERMHELGRMFRNAGVYMARRFPHEGTRTATATILQFYDYGNDLLQTEREKPIDETTVQEIAGLELTPEEETEVDRWLLGDQTYERRIERIRRQNKLDPEDEVPTALVEPVRQKLLQTFFTAVERTGRIKDDPAEPWRERRGPVAKLQKKAEAGIRQGMQMPERELHSAIFDRGLELLAKQIGHESITSKLEQLDAELELHRATLREALGIEDMARNLSEVRQSGSPETIATLEKSYADRIQQIIGSYDYVRTRATPAQILANQELNCVGASILGSAFLSELGIAHLCVTVPAHILLVVATADDRLHWQDMLIPENNREIEDSMLQRGSTQELLALARGQGHAQHTTCELTPQVQRELMPFDWYDRTPKITAYEPRVGKQMAVLGWANDYLFNEREFRAASQASRIASELIPGSIELKYKAVDRAKYHPEDRAECIEKLREVIAASPDNPEPYYTLGLIYLEEHEGELSSEAMACFQRSEEACRRILKQNPESTFHTTLLVKILREQKRPDDTRQAMARATDLYRRQYQKNDSAELCDALSRALAESSYIQIEQIDQDADEIEHAFLALAAYNADPLRTKNLPMVARALEKYFDIPQTRIYERCVQHEPENPGFRSSYAAALFNEERYEESLEQWRIVQSQDRNHISAGLFISDCLVRLGRASEAVQVMEGYAAQQESAEQTSDKKILKAPLQARLCECYRANGDLEKAATAIDAALADDPENIEVQWNLGKLRESQGSFDEAMDAYWKAYLLIGKSVDEILYDMLRISSQTTTLRHQFITMPKLLFELTALPIRDAFQNIQKERRFDKACAKIAARNPKFSPYFDMRELEQ